MGKNLAIAFLSMMLLQLGILWPGLAKASDSQPSAQIKIPKGYDGMARAGYPIDTIMAIDRMDRERKGLEFRIRALSNARGWLSEAGYREPLIAGWLWAPPRGHPDGSLWLLGQYISQAWEARQEQFEALSEATAQARHTLRDLNVAIESADAVSYAEASIQGKILREERALKEKYGKLARGIGAKPPWEMLTETAIRDAMTEKR